MMTEEQIRQQQATAMQLLETACKMVREINDELPKKYRVTLSCLAIFSLTPPAEDETPFSVKHLLEANGSPLIMSTGLAIAAIKSPYFENVLKQTAVAISHPAQIEQLRENLQDEDDERDAYQRKNNLQKQNERWRQKNKARSRSQTWQQSR